MTIGATMAERNPYAPKGALTLDDIRSGLVVEVYRQGTQPPAVERFTLQSGVLGRGLGRLLTVRVRAANGRRDTLFLADMGVCPDSEDTWSRNYTLRANS